MPGATVEIRGTEAPFDAYVSRPTRAGVYPGCVFFMDGLGLRPALFGMADRLAEFGYVVAMPNLYHRQGSYAPFDPATVFSGGGPEFERVVAMVGATSDEGAMADTRAVLDFLEGDAGVAEGKRCAVGYCLGGGMAMRAACDLTDRFALAASFHGGRFVVEEGAPALLAAKATARLHFGVAEIDRRHTAETTERLERALAPSGIAHEIELYAGASHGFAVPDLPVYHQAAAERHWGKLEGLLRATFPQG
jgi:carboxymethylenebutenolidase